MLWHWSSFIQCELFTLNLFLVWVSEVWFLSWRYITFEQHNALDSMEVNCNWVTCCKILIWTGILVRNTFLFSENKKRLIFFWGGIFHFLSAELQSCTFIAPVTFLFCSDPLHTIFPIALLQKQSLCELIQSRVESMNMRFWGRSLSTF